ncbi:MAG: two-component system sensor histidine kinase QseC [Arenicella sp.]|jgi:two-component system sensor histidine kinase QseC
MKSIRIFLIVVLLSTICIVNFSAALNGYNRSTEAGNSLLDVRLKSMALMTARLYAMHGEVDSAIFDDDTIFQIWQGDKLLSKSVNAPSTGLVSGLSEYHVVNSAGIQWRVHSRNTANSDVHVIYGERYDVYRQLIDGIILASLLPIVWVLPLIALLIWLIVSYGLMPLSSFADKLAKRSANELNPIEAEGLPNELSPLLDSTNTLFERLSEAFGREQRFAADAAHELRTPLAGLKVSLHNLEREHSESNDNIIDLKLCARRMENSIEQILALYKLTPETFKQTLARCMLKAHVQQTLIDLFPAIELKEQEVEFIAQDVVIEADEFAISMLIKNLIENASKYTPSNGSILVTIQDADEDTVKLTVEDSGPGITEQDYARVFDRFYRAGGDRHCSDVIGSGLGLSIVSHVVKLHMGSIDLSKSLALGGLRVTVLLPKSQSKESLS